MSAARHPQIEGPIERVDETIQIALRYYSIGSVFWLGISLLIFITKFSTCEASTHFLLKVSYEYLPVDCLIDYGQ